MKKKYTIGVSGRVLHVWMGEDRHVQIDGVDYSVNMAEYDEGSFSLILNGRSFTIVHHRTKEWLSSPSVLSEAPMLIQVDGQNYSVVVDDERSLLQKSMLKQRSSIKTELSVHAPMPGLVSRIEVSEGEIVNEGHGLIVLEAMKMENELKSPQAGRIERIHVQSGSPVDKGELLITIAASDRDRSGHEKTP